MGCPKSRFPIWISSEGFKAKVGDDVGEDFILEIFSLKAIYMWLDEFDHLNLNTSTISISWSVVWLNFEAQVGALYVILFHNVVEIIEIESFWFMMRSLCDTSLWIIVFDEHELIIFVSQGLTLSTASLVSTKLISTSKSEKIFSGTYVRPHALHTW